MSDTSKKTVSRQKYEKLKASLKESQNLIKILKQQNAELIDEIESLKGVISVFSEQKLEQKNAKITSTEGEDEEEFEDNVESFNKSDVKDDNDVKMGRNVQFRDRTNTQVDAPIEKDKKRFNTEKKISKSLKAYEEEMKLSKTHKKSVSTVDYQTVSNTESEKSSEGTQKAHIFDENTVLDILCGLGITSSRKFDDSVLVPDDYSYSYQFKVNRTSNQLLKFKDFAPKVFRQIRQQWNIPNEDLLFSFRFDNLDAIRGEGKSGAFFIFTKDKRFILKTATKDERDFLWEILPYYLLYIRKNPNTLLPRFYGVYSMKHEGIGGVTRFVIMNNWFNTSCTLHEIYDLKGSTVGRTNVEGKGSILKDLDIKRKFYMKSDIKQKFLEQLEKDAQFLAQHNIMDYSLLVGISYNKDGSNLEIKKTRDDNSVISIFQEADGGILGYNHQEKREEVIFCGIIDILQQYNGRKKLEHLFKSMAYNSDRISIVQPSYYAKRFVQFITSLCEDEERPKKKKKRNVNNNNS